MGFIEFTQLGSPRKSNYDIVNYQRGEKSEWVKVWRKTGRTDHP